MALYCDLNTLRWRPPSAVNCNEDGHPKTVLMGNVVRTFDSSQSWKRRIRLFVEEATNQASVRTRLIPAHIAHLLTERGWPSDLATFAGEQVVRSACKAGLERDPREPIRTLVMPWLAHDALAELAAVCEEYRTALQAGLDEQAVAAAPAEGEPGEAMRPARRPTRRARKTDDETAAPILPIARINPLIITRTPSIDLCGRMLADVPGGHVDGALQLAPAIATHQSDNQPDFFTTVEDLPGPHDSGGAHLQTQYRATSTMHQYATVNLTELAGNRGSMTAALALLPTVIEAFVLTVPQANRTSTAPHTLPVLVHYALREGRPVSYAGAFDHPVRAEHGGYTLPSVQALDRHAGALAKMLGRRRAPIAHGYLSQHEGALEHLGQAHADLDELIDAVVRAATTHTDQARAGA